MVVVWWFYGGSMVAPMPEILVYLPGSQKMKLFIKLILLIF